MSRLRIRVLHWLLAKTASRHGVHPEYNLLHVAYDRSSPLGTTFSEKWTWREPPGLYLRVAAWEAGLTEILVQVHYRRRRRVWERTTAFHDPGHPYHFPVDRAVVFSDWIKLPYLTLHGFGLYAATIYFRAARSGEDEDEEPGEETRTRPWDPEDLGEGWVFGAVDYFRVVTP
jgi:hypothetical protein